MVTLQEVKQYLRIDFEEEDPLLLSLLATAKQQVMNVGRMDEAQLSEHEDTARTASSMRFPISTRTAIPLIFPS